MTWRHTNLPAWHTRPPSPMVNAVSSMATGRYGFSGAGRLQSAITIELSSEKDGEMNYYEVLGLPRDASPEEVRHAYSAKAMQLAPARADGAPTEVVDAVNRARAVIDDAGRILGDAALRARYDSEIDPHGVGDVAHPEGRSPSDVDSSEGGLAGPRSYLLPGMGEPDLQPARRT